MQIKSDSNGSALKDLAMRVEGLSGVNGKVGWFQGARYEDGTSVAYVAAIQELGHGPIPPRSFMRSTAEEKQQEWKATAKIASAQVVNGNLDGEQAMEVITARAEGDISKKIATITSPPLSPITLGARKYRQMGKKVTGATIGEIARKLEEGTLDISGVSTKPLVDTGVMVATLTHVVGEGE